MMAALVVLMNNNTAILRGLITYAICVPLAIIFGYLVVQMVSSPDRSNITTIGVVALFFALPILLRWHYPLMIFCWNFPLMVFFLPGSPAVFLPMMGISLGISILQRTMNRDLHFIRAPQITLPLVALAVVVYVTAKLTGGIGLHSMGDSTMGGKKYVFLLAGIFSYFALTARRIPPQKAPLYLALFFLPTCASVIGDLARVIPSSFNYIFLFFPPNFYAAGDIESGMLRLPGVGMASVAVISFMLVRYGVRGIFLSRKLWRPVVFILSFVMVFYGGFRSLVCLCAVVFLIQFFLEGLHRTKLLPLMVFVAVFAAALCVPLANKLPLTFQRALSFLPLDIDPMVKLEAEGSWDWRVQMWQAMLPKCPSICFWEKATPSPRKIGKQSETTRLLKRLTPPNKVWRFPVIIITDRFP